MIDEGKLKELLSRLIELETAPSFREIYKKLLDEIFNGEVKSRKENELVLQVLNLKKKLKELENKEIRDYTNGFADGTNKTIEETKRVLEYQKKGFLRKINRWYFDTRKRKSYVDLSDVKELIRLIDSQEMDLPEIQTPDTLEQKNASSVKGFNKSDQDEASTPRGRLNHRGLVGETSPSSAPELNICECGHSREEHHNEIINKFCKRLNCKCPKFKSKGENND